MWWDIARERVEGYCTYDAQAAGVGHGRSQLCVADPLHASLHDGDYQSLAYLCCNAAWRDAYP